MRPCSAAPMLAAATALAAVNPGVAGAQAETRKIAGTVVDSANNKPVSGAAIYLDRTATAERTAKDGTFHVDAGTGEIILVVRRRGFVPVQVPVPAGAETNVGVTRIHQLKTDADRAAVDAEDLPAYPRLASFYDRRAKYRRGAFFTPDDLEGNAGSIADMIRRKRGFGSICLVNRQEQLDCGKKSDRGPSTIMGSGQSANERICIVRVWTDNVGPEQTLDELRVDDVLAVEAYPTPSATPPDFPGSDCASVRLWMKQVRP